jgi:hypothetical protein
MVRHPAETDNSAITLDGVGRLPLFTELPRAFVLGNQLKDRIALWQEDAFTTIFG